jgi:hypothetical protein
MQNTESIGIWIRRFLLEYLIKERNFSRNTQASYRDGFKHKQPILERFIDEQIDRTGLDLPAFEEYGELDIVATVFIVG